MNSLLLTTFLFHHILCPNFPLNILPLVYLKVDKCLIYKSDYPASVCYNNYEIYECSPLFSKIINC